MSDVKPAPPRGADPKTVVSKPDAAVAAPATAPVAQRQKVQISEQAVKLAEVGRNLWHAVAPYTHTLEDALDPSYMWHSHARIQPGDRIEIRHQLHQFLVELYVVEVDKDTQAILTYPLAVHDFAKAELRVADLTGATVEEMGANKWCIQQGRRVLKSGFDTELEAQAWLAKKKQPRTKAAAVPAPTA